LTEVKNSRDQRPFISWEQRTCHKGTEAIYQQGTEAIYQLGTEARIIREKRPGGIFKVRVNKEQRPRIAEIRGQKGSAGNRGQEQQRARSG
jgi:hypothetical protein